MDQIIKFNREKGNWVRIQENLETVILEWGIAVFLSKPRSFKEKIYEITT